MRTRTVIGIIVFLGVGPVLPVANAQGTPDTEPRLVCGLEVYPSPTALPEPEPSPDPQPSPGPGPDPTADPCVDGQFIFGPARFERTNGKPLLVVSDFQATADGDICIASQSGGKGKPFISLDDEPIARPNNFNDNHDMQTHTVAPGTHRLGVMVAGEPQGYLDIEIRQLAPGGDDGGDDPPGLPEPGETQIDPLTGAVDMVNAAGSVRLQNVATDHPLLNGDTTVLQALTTPLIALPGKDDGSVAYFLDWAFQVTDLQTCGLIETGLSGSEQINSPTQVTTTWGGDDISGVPLPPGNYAYSFDVNVVDETDTVFGNITSPGFGLVIDNTESDYDETAEHLGNCDLGTDPAECRCPGVNGVPGTPDPNCEFAFYSNLLPEFEMPDPRMPHYIQPELVDKSFIQSTLDPVSGRYTVIVDLRDYNAGGLVPNTRPFWADETELRQWVSDMTGVPISTGDSLFNFDYVQLGNATGIYGNGTTPHSFNHFFLDAITDPFGFLRLGPTGTDLAPLFNTENNPPPQFVVDSPRTGDECSNSANTDGVESLRGKFCAYNTAFRVGAESDLGVYMLRTTLFDFELSNETTTQDQLCVINGIFTCGVRTIRVPADVLEIESSYYDQISGVAVHTRNDTMQLVDAVGVSVSIDRGAGEDGVCSRAIATKGGLAVRMDSADGAVPDSCVINGIF